MPHQSLSLEDLVSRLAWHNPAMPFIHTVPARSEEFLLLWCLAYDYPHWRTSTELAQATGFRRETVLKFRSAFRNSSK